MGRGIVGCIAGQERAVKGRQHGKAQGCVRRAGRRATNEGLNKAQKGWVKQRWVSKRRQQGAKKDSRTDRGTEEQGW